MHQPAFHQRVVHTGAQQVADNLERGREGPQVGQGKSACGAMADACVTKEQQAQRCIAKSRGEQHALRQRCEPTWFHRLRWRWLEAESVGQGGKVNAAWLALWLLQKRSSKRTARGPAAAVALAIPPQANSSHRFQKSAMLVAPSAARQGELGV